MIYITGDTHIPIDINKLSTSNFPEQKQMTKNDYVIICGDFGGVWNNSKEEIYWRKWLNEKKFTTLFVDGNHENFNLLNQYPIEYWHGGKVHKIMSSIYHLIRGQVFDINGYKIFTMGGAFSHDKEWRKEGESWWADEMPSKSEYEEGMNNLDKVNWNVDYVISHTASKEIIRKISNYKTDELNSFFSIIDKRLNFKHWYFGHFHNDKDIDNKHTLAYYNIIPII